jgi:hypothetical protein
MAGVGTGRCIGNQANFNQQNNCPTAPIKDFQFTEGPVPAAGGLVSNLQAEAAAAVPMGKSTTVNVLDETPAGAQTVVLSCPVAVGARTCANPGTVTVAAGHYLMVRIDTTAPGTGWRVAFRF